MCLGINVYLEICDSNRLWEEVGFIFLDSSIWMFNIIFTPFHGIAPLSKVYVLVNNKMVNIIDPHYFRNGQCLGGAGAIREL